MATFLPQVQTKIPQLETFTPDYKFLQDVLETRQDRYTNNYNALNDLYGKIVYADLSRDDNKEIRDQFSKELTPKLEQISGLDLSLQENVNTAKGLFAPFYDDKAMVKDIYFTKQYGRQMQYAQNLLNSSEESERNKYSDWGVKDLQYQMQDFKSDTREESINRANPSFTNNVNLVQRGIDALKEIGMSIKKTTSDGKWLITQKNGSLLTNQFVGYEPILDANGQPTGEVDTKKPIFSSPAMEYLQERLIHDPEVAKAYYVKNRTLARIEAEANSEKFGSYEGAQEAWAKGILEKYGIEMPKEIARVNNMLQDKTRQSQGWEAYKEERGILPGSPEEDMLLKSQFESQILNDTVQLKNKTYKDVGGKATSLQSLLEKAYRAESAMQMNADMAKAAIAYSNIDYEETRVADPFALKQLQFQYDIMKQNNKYRLDKSLAKYKANLEGTDKSSMQNIFSPEGNPNAPSIKQDRFSVERQQYDVIDRYSDQHLQANMNLIGKKIQFAEQVYNNLDTYQKQLRTADGESILSPEGMLNYKRAVTDDAGNFLRYENVTKTWADAMSDFSGANAMMNEAEAERIFNSAYKQAFSRDFESDDLNVPIPLNAELWRQNSPQLQDAFNNARTTILAYQARMLQADQKFNATLHAAYEKWNAEASQREGGYRTGAKWSGRDQKKYDKKLDKAEKAFMGESAFLGWQDLDKKGQRKLDAANRKASTRSEHDWGMFPPILTDKQIKDLRSGKLWTDIMADGEEVTGVSADSPIAGNMRMLGEKEYINLLVANIRNQEQEVLDRFNEYRQTTGKRGRRFERNDEFLTRDKRNFLGLWKKMRYGENDAPTIVGKFWDWDSGSGQMFFDQAKATKYAESYYNSVLTGMNATMTDADAAGTQYALPSDWNQLFNNTPGDGSGDALQHNVYGFTYDGLSPGSPQSQLAIPQLNNLFSMFNTIGEENMDAVIGAQGNKIPDPRANWRRGKGSREKRKGKDGGIGQDYQAAMQLLSQIQIDMGTGATSKGTTPQFEIEYRENIGSSGMGSYTIILGEEYANKYKKSGALMEDNDAFQNSNAVTFYFKKDFDRSDYKAINKSFDDIKVLTDINGTFKQQVAGGGEYWFTRNSAGQYVANVVLHKFDPNAKAFVHDSETKQQIVVDPSVTNMTNLASQLDNHLRQTADFNFQDQEIYKGNYTEE